MQHSSFSVRLHQKGGQTLHMTQMQGDVKSQILTAGKAEEEPEK